MELLCELGTEEKVISRGRYAGQTTEETLLIGACKYSWTFAKQASGGQPVGLKHYGSFKHLLPSICDHFKLDPAHTVKLVMENLPRILPMAEEENKEEIVASLESSITKLIHCDGSDCAEKVLAEIGKGLDELYHCNYASAIHEKTSGNVYTRIKA